MRSSQRDAKVQVPIIIVIDPGRSMPISWAYQARSGKDVSKCSVPVIPINVGCLIEMIVGEEIKVAIVIEVTPDWITKGIAPGLHPRRRGDVRKDWQI